MPVYLGEVPIDPFHGGPLRYRRLADGVSIDAAGLKEQVSAADIGRQPLPEESGVGFRLWDVKQRRQPPPPVAVRR